MGNKKKDIEKADKLKKAKQDALESIKGPWRKYREDLSTQKTDLERQSDKTVFTISTGAIGVSLVIIDKLTPSEGYRYLYFILAISWILLILSIILQAISFNNTAKKIGDSIENVDLIVEADNYEEMNKHEETYYSKWRSENKAITKQSKNAIILMIAGIVLLLIFSFLSLYQKSSIIIQK